MLIGSFIETIKEIDNPNCLRCVSDTTFQDSVTSKYYTSTTKGLNSFYRSLGLYDKVFIRKLRSVDQVCSDNLVNKRLSEVGSENVYFVVDNNLRVMDRDLYKVMMKFLDEAKKCDKNADVSCAKDSIEVVTSSKYDDGVTYSLYSYGLADSKLTHSYYAMEHDMFFGMNDWSYKLDDELLIQFDTLDVVSRYLGAVDYKVTWEIASNVVRKLRDRSDRATKILVENQPNQVTAFPYTAKDLYSLIYDYWIVDSYKNDFAKFRRCIDQSDYVNRNACPE